jgi:PAS domain S-box-containing protein
MKTVKLATDDNPFAQTLRPLLEARGFSVSLCGEAQHGGEHDSRPQAMVADVRNTEAQALRDLIRLAAASPVLVVVRDVETRQDAFDAGAFDVLVWPVDPAVLEHVLDTFTQRVRRVSRGAAGRFGCARREGELQCPYFELFMNAPMGVFEIGLDGRLNIANRELASIYGYSSPEEMVAEVRDIGRQCWFDPVVFRRRVQRTLQTGTTTDQKTLGLRRDGSLVWLRVTMRVKPSGTDRIRRLDGHVYELCSPHETTLLRESEHSLRNALDRAPIGTFVATSGGGWRNINNVFAKMLGFETPEELMVNWPNVSDVYMDPSHREEVQNIYRERGEVRGLQVMLRRKDGRPLWVSLYGRMVRDLFSSDAVHDCFAIDVTEQKMAEHALEESRAQLQLVLDVSPLPILITSLATGKPLYANEMAATILDAVQGTRGDAGAGVSRTQREAILELLLRDGRVREYDISVPDAAGNPLWFTASATLIEYKGEQAVLGAFLDITDKVESKRRLQEAYTELDQVFHSAGSGMLLLRKDGRIHKVNRRLLEILGRKEQDLLGFTCREIGLGDRCDSGSCPLRLMEGGALRNECERVIKRPDGSPRYLAKVATPFKDAEGRLQGIVLSISDVTPQVSAAEEARLRQQQLVQADKLASLGVLVSGVAHEINNPTGVISLNAPLLLRIWGDAAPFVRAAVRSDGHLKLGGLRGARALERAPQLLAQIIDSSRRIKRIVSELKDFARKDATDMTQAVNLGKVVRTASSLAWNKVKKATRNYEVDAGLEDLWTRGNAQRLEQVLLNVIINACEALTGQEQPIRVSLKRAAKKGSAVIEVQDQGQGVKPEDMSQILDPFFTTKRDSGGTGLGLSVSHGIIQEHGGEIVYESEPGKGTLCRILLPLIDSEP